MRHFIVSVHLGGFAEKSCSGLSEVFLFGHLNLSHSSLNIVALLIQLRLVNAIKLALLFLLEIALHLDSAVVFLSSTESVSFRDKSRRSRPSIMIDESVSVSRLGTESSSVNEF